MFRELWLMIFVSTYLNVHSILLFKMHSILIAVCVLFIDTPHGIWIKELCARVKQAGMIVSASY